MKKIGLTIIFFLNYNFIQAQPWSMFSSSPIMGQITALAEYNGELYITGNIEGTWPHVSGDILKWNGMNWMSVGGDINGGIHALVVHNGELYAGGQFTSAGGVPAKNVARWNGTSWSALGNGVHKSVTALAFYNNELYAGFGYSSVDPSSNLICKWDGVSWTSVGGGVIGHCAPEMVALAVFNGELYAGGQFDSAGNVAADNIARWNGSTWSPVGNHADVLIAGFAVTSDGLYTNGANPFSPCAITKWDGMNWTFIALPDHYVYSLAAHNDNIYFTGLFDSVNASIPAKQIAMWDGTNIVSFGNGLVGLPGRSIIVHDNQLIAGGGPFQNLLGGFAYSSSLAKWNLNVGFEDTGLLSSINIFPNPTSGNFTLTTSSGSKNNQFEIYNSMGEKIFQQRISSNQTNVNLSSQPSGVYFVRILNNEREITRKIILSE